jgi:DNA-directed RNA polymerase specialized sigma24 family protein
MDDESGIGIDDEVMKSAEAGAVYGANGRTEIAQEAKQETVLLWKLRVAQGEPPANPNGWAFICARNYARKRLKASAREIGINDVADLLFSVSEESALIERLEPPAINWLHAADANRAITEFVRLAIQIVDATPDEIDRQIIDMHYRKRWDFFKISQELHISRDTARKRWWRMIDGLTDSIMSAIKADEKLAQIFAAILEDRDDFRMSLLGILSIVSKRGLPALHEIIEAILPA